MRQEFLIRILANFRGANVIAIVTILAKITYLGDEACQKKECISIDSCAKME